MQFSEGTNKTLEMDNEDDMGTVPRPAIGDDIPFALTVTGLESLDVRSVNFKGSQVIWSVAPVSIIQSLVLVTTEEP